MPLYPYSLAYLDARPFYKLYDFTLASLENEAIPRWGSLESLGMQIISLKIGEMGYKFFLVISFSNRKFQSCRLTFYYFHYCTTISDQ